MGVQGSGKSTIGTMLAERLGVPFLDADSLHTAANKQWMASGRALSDAQRLPWLHEVGAGLGLAAGSGIVVACSALKRSYRDLLREHAPAMFTVFAHGDQDLIYERVRTRRHQFMPPSLLPAQFEDLEERQVDEPGVTVDSAQSRDRLSISWWHSSPSGALSTPTRGRDHACCRPLVRDHARTEDPAGPPW
jgi:gluconokinase